MSIEANEQKPVDFKKEWNTRAKRPGLASVMSIRWNQLESTAATTILKAKVFGALGNLRG